jgi:hypothetical protein
MTEFDKWLETKMMGQKILFVMRGLPSAGKSTTVKELLLKYGGTPEGHVFSTDTWYHPITTKLRTLGHITPESISKEQAYELCKEIKKMWVTAELPIIKAEGQDAFGQFEVLADKNRYYEALSAAQSMIDLLETVEYRSNWHGSKLKAAHGDNLTRFKLAVDQGVTPLIVDNTNVTKDRIIPYSDYAKKAGYEIQIKEPTSPHWLAHRDLLADKSQNREKLDDFAKLLADKNTHGVPVDAIKNMMAQWQHNLTPKMLEKH